MHVCSKIVRENDQLHPDMVHVCYAYIIPAASIATEAAAIFTTMHVMWHKTSMHRDSRQAVMFVTA